MELSIPIHVESLLRTVGIFIGVMFTGKWMKKSAILWDEYIMMIVTIVAFITGFKILK